MVRKRKTEKAKPFSIRFTESERALLRERAGNEPLGVFARNQLLGCEVKERATRTQSAHDQRMLARVLALLGQSGLAQNVSVLTELASAGVLPCDEATTARLSLACDQIAVIRETLMAALGKDHFIPRRPIEFDLLPLFNDASGASED